MKPRTSQGKLLSARRPYLWLAAFALLAAQLALAYGFARNNSMTFDEPIHIHGGLRILHDADFSVNPESGTLSQLWLALPVAYTPALKALDVLTCRNASVPAELASDAVLLRARMMTALLSCALGAGIFLFALRFLSGTAALLTLGLYTTHPLIVSNGALATSDVAGAAGFFFALLLSWEALRRVTVWRLLAAGLALGILFLAKMSAALILPTLALFVAVRTCSRYPLRIQLPGWTALIRPKGRKAAAMGAALTLALLVAWGAIWAAHGFRYRMTPTPGTIDNIAEVTKFDGRIPPLTRLAAKLKFLPEAYLYGFAYTVRHSQYRPSFFHGELSERGHVGFFPYLFLVKNPLGMLALSVVGAACLAVFRERRQYLALMPLLLFSALFTYFSLRSSMNIGLRHLLPIFPLVFLVCGVAAERLLQLRKRSWRLVACLFMLCATLEPLAAMPSCLAYFNCLDGGPEKAYRHVVDSSLDWGQDLANLRQTLVEHGLTPERDPIYLAYFGVAPIPCAGFAPRLLQCFPSNQPRGVHDLEPGHYCVSATMLQCVYDKPEPPAGQDPAEYPKLARLFKTALATGERPADLEQFAKDIRRYEVLRFERLRRFLLRREPDFDVGHSILVYKLTTADLAAVEALKR